NRAGVDVVGRFSLTSLRTLVCVLPILQAKAWEEYLVAEAILPTSFPDPDDVQTGTALSLRIRCIEDTGGIDATRSPTFISVTNIRYSSGLSFPRRSMSAPGVC